MIVTNNKHMLISFVYNYEIVEITFFDERKSIFCSDAQKSDIVNE